VQGVVAIVAFVVGVHEAILLVESARRVVSVDARREIGEAVRAGAADEGTQQKSAPTISFAGTEVKSCDIWPAITLGLPRRRKPALSRLFVDRGAEIRTRDL
jgi:hypothetical protein